MPQAQLPVPQLLWYQLEGGDRCFGGMGAQISQGAGLWPFGTDLATWGAGNTQWTWLNARSSS